MNEQAKPSRRQVSQGLMATGAALFSGMDAVANDLTQLPARLRLIGQSPSGDGKTMAGVHLALNDGWKTFWRFPGGSGIPPQFDWSGSRNLQATLVSYPAPQRLGVGNGAFFGYSQEVVFPVEVTANDPSLPVDLVLNLTYGLCDKVCIPAESTSLLRLTPGLVPAPPDRLLQRFLARVPRRLPRGEAVRDWVFLPGERRIEFTAELVGGIDFVVLDGPVEWGFSMAQPIATTGSATRFSVMIDHVPATGAAKEPLNLTIVGKRAAVEEQHTLDG